MSIFNDCRDCKNYKGNCGKHFIDWNNHINYDIPAEAYTADVFSGEHGSCFEPSEKYKQEQLHKVAEELSKYSIETLTMALEIAKENNDAAQN